MNDANRAYKIDNIKHTLIWINRLKYRNKQLSRNSIGIGVV